MQGNSFRGNITSSLSALRGLQVLDLSRNKFDGTVPEYLAEFSLLLAFNQSFNDLEGALSEAGMFKNASAISVAGNLGLCGGVADLTETAKMHLKWHRESGFEIVISSTIVLSLLVVFSSSLSEEKENSALL